MVGVLPSHEDDRGFIGIMHYNIHDVNLNDVTLICKYELNLRIDKGSRCVFRCTSILLIILLLIVLL